MARYSRGDKWKGLFLGIVIGLAMMSVGVIVFMKSTLISFQEAKEVGPWVEVKANLIHVDFKKEMSRDTLLYQVIADYRYIYNGMEHRGNRVGLGKRMDADEEWHRKWYNHLKSMQRQQKPITVFVNPNNSNESIINRDIRWGDLFGSFGVSFFFFVAGSFIIYRVSQPDETKILRTHKYHDGKVRSVAFRAHTVSPSKPKGCLVFVLTIPVGVMFFMILPSMEMSFIQYLIEPIMIFIAGLALFVSIFRDKQVWKRIGKLPLTGEFSFRDDDSYFKGRIKLPPNFGEGVNFDFKIRYLNVVTTSNSKSGAFEHVVWKGDIKPTIHEGYKNKQLEILIKLPDDLPPNKSLMSNYNIWKLLLTGVLNGEEFTREYVVEI